MKSFLHCACFRSSSGGQNDEEDEDSDGGGGGGVTGGASAPAGGGDDEDLEGRDYSWKKTIMIGPSFQASVPHGLSSYEGHTLPYENEDRLLWDPKRLDPGEVEDYLVKHQEAKESHGAAVLPIGQHTRDDEQVSQALFANY